MARYRKQDAAERRTAFFGFQLTPTERAKLERRAAASGLHLSEYCRRMALSDAREPAPAARDPAALRGIRAEIAHVGNNWNQMTHHVNATGDVPSQKVLKEIGDAIMAALKKVREL
jgi:Bacterial mobilisation protein (MobC)